MVSAGLKVHQTLLLFLQDDTIVHEYPECVHVYILKTFLKNEMVLLYSNL